jgi:hypothetical protein
MPEAKTRIRAGRKRNLKIESRYLRNKRTLFPQPVKFSFPLLKSGGSHRDSAALPQLRRRARDLCGDFSGKISLELGLRRAHLLINENSRLAEIAPSSYTLPGPA